VWVVHSRCKKGPAVPRQILERVVRDSRNKRFEDRVWSGSFDSDLKRLSGLKAKLGAGRSRLYKPNGPKTKLGAGRS
jgi:hypothetical protein